MIPGEVIVSKEEIVLNENKKTIVLKVKNIGDRPVQVGSHFHFFEVNKLLQFKREQAYGMRLDIASGTSVRFEPGEEKEITLVELGGNKRVFGLNGLTSGQVNCATLERSMHNAKTKKFI